ncbi:hypothetical protein IEQ_05037 [Bacillus cereus BAG6X1-2]|nr:hypothetical protein IEQ_05037 [Bacillus cereus BAG6X1-2]
MGTFLLCYEVSCIYQKSIGLASELGYEVIEIHAFMWKEGRTEWTCLLKTGTTDIEGIRGLVVQS